MPIAADQHAGIPNWDFTGTRGHSCSLSPHCTAMEDQWDVWTLSYWEATLYRSVGSHIHTFFPPEPLSCINAVHVFQWMERKPDGGVVFRSVRAEEREERRYNINKQKAMEVLYAKIQSEFEKEERGRSNICIVSCAQWNGIRYWILWTLGKNKPQRRRRTISRQDIANLQDGEELYEALGDDPAYLEVNWTQRYIT